MAREQHLEDLQRFCDTIPLTAVFPRPFDADGVRLQVHRLLGLAADDLMSSERRLEQAAFALGYLAQLAKTGERMHSTTCWPSRPSWPRHYPIPVSARQPLAFWGYWGPRMPNARW